MALTAIHPGEHLAEELKALGMSAAELARNLKVPTNRVTQILNGTRAITGDTALRLAHFFGTNPQFWLKSAEPLRTAPRPAKVRQIDRETASPEAPPGGVRTIRGRPALSCFQGWRFRGNQTVRG